MKMRMDIRGALDFGRANRRVETAIREGLTDGAEYLLSEANKIVPYMEGTLEGSGTTDYDPMAHEASISYDTPYAVRLHEHPEYHFANNREGKWLEKTINTKGNRAISLIQDSLRKALEK